MTKARISENGCIHISRPAPAAAKTPTDGVQRYELDLTQQAGLRYPGVVRLGQSCQLFDLMVSSKR